MSLVRDGGKGTSVNGDRPENSTLLAAMSMDPTITPITPYTTCPDTLTLVPEDHEFYSSMDSLAWMNTPRGHTGNTLAARYRNGPPKGMTWTDKLLNTQHIETRPLE